MNEQQYRAALLPPKGCVDVILDTDAYNELDDQFALAYMLRATDRLNPVGITAAPFFNSNSSSPEDGMLRSYDEILKILRLAERTDLCDRVFYGSRAYLADERMPQPSDAADFICRQAAGYSADRPLYIVAIGAITNVASALLMHPEIADRVVIVWLGGHAHHFRDTREFNMWQDVAAARVVFLSGAPIIQLPCMGVVSEFRISGPELNCWLAGKNPLADYLARNTVEAVERYAKGRPWTRVIWDVTAVAYLLNEDDCFMRAELRPIRLPGYDGQYEKEETAREYVYVSEIYRDALMGDLIRRLREED